MISDTRQATVWAGRGHFAPGMPSTKPERGAQEVESKQ
jgi:hypothetical protein